ncbi:hypothetical protein L7F22_064532 [Adiantum nelumboides]|nr:hypothetical protein [Adiantum nelumboides]
MAPIDKREVEEMIAKAVTQAKKEADKALNAEVRKMAEKIKQMEEERKQLEEQITGLKEEVNVLKGEWAASKDTKEEGEIHEADKEAIKEEITKEITKAMEFKMEATKEGWVDVVRKKITKEVKEEKRNEETLWMHATLKEKKMREARMLNVRVSGIKEEHGSSPESDGRTLCANLGDKYINAWAEDTVVFQLMYTIEDLFASIGVVIEDIQGLVELTEDAMGRNKERGIRDLKNLLTLDTGLEPQQQRLLYRGKEKDNRVYLHDAGVRNKSKIVLKEDPSSQEKRLVESRRDEAIAMACRAVADVNEEVDKIAEKVFAVEAAVKSGRRLKESAIAEPTELLMCQLLKLDSIEAEGEAKSQRRILVRRVQKYVETLDMLKIQNETPVTQRTVVTTKWETFDAGLVGATSARPQHSGRMLPQTATSSAVGAVADWKWFN